MEEPLMPKSQCIHCQVESCQYHATDNCCSLDDIQVMPCSNCHSGKAADESQCASYCCRK